MTNVKKERQHFIDGLIDTYQSTLDIKGDLNSGARPEHYRGHFINALSLASSSFMDVHPNARELWPTSPTQEGGKTFFFYKYLLQFQLNILTPLI